MSNGSLQVSQCVVPAGGQTAPLWCSVGAPIHQNGGVGFCEPSSRRETHQQAEQSELSLIMERSYLSWVLQYF